MTGTKIPLIQFITKFDLSNYTALIPSVGVGNVGQLAADLLISTLEMEKIATVWHPAIIPIIGSHAFEHDNGDQTTISCELYRSATKKLLILQIRSPLVAPLMEEFFAALISVFKTENIRNLIVLTSSYAYEMHAVDSTPFRYVASDKFCVENRKLLNNLEWIEFKEQTIYGGGFAVKLMEAAVSDGIETMIVFKYVSEGDNTPDAMNLVGFINNFFNFLQCNGAEVNEKIKFKIPISWKLLYGNAPNEQLY